VSATFGNGLQVEPQVVERRRLGSGKNPACPP